ncbi:aldo/keto reductase [Salisediminibacterium selenitireducens]|uniref:Aldo/keto reductase n=1 Tax=Bacillus selenitireducens (strain ATCC 700615 / DSM 15326 / MLS10) TaxID=439292 RepID=D6XZR5_BACIE|nr:aldo/keto reductase [Salisediminibacterium selenitireducens]ADI00417.1 aldo/keto reductase [[Bacillus] selenitireducens MLS10]
MKTRSFGREPQPVSEIGLGAWQLGNRWGSEVMSEEEGIAIVEEALNRGCTFFDTAPNYALGNSERILGKALKGKRDRVVIMSKFGHHDDGEIDFDAKRIRESAKKSLERLQTDYLDALLLHNPPKEIVRQDDPHFLELEAMKQEGIIKRYGVSVDTEDEMKNVMNNTDSEVMEVMYNIFHQGPANAFKEAEDKGIDLVIKVPLDSGWLSGKYSPESTFEDIRSRWTPEIRERRAEMLREVKQIVPDDRSLIEHAMQFILARKEVTTVIPGAKTLDQLRTNLSSGEEAMDPGVREKLVAMWEQSLKDHGLPW